MTLTVRVKDPAKVAQVQDAIKKMGFRTFSVLDATKSLRRFFTVLDLFLGIFGSLALAVATLAIINTLVMAVLERRREIGVMKAIGASDGDVKRLFFAEAGAMGFFGGVLGIALGFAIGKAINIGTGIYLHQPSIARRGSMDHAAVADRRGHCVLHRGQPAGWPVSRQPRRAARSGADAEIRMRKPQESHEALAMSDLLHQQIGEWLARSQFQAHQASRCLEIVERQLPTTSIKRLIAASASRVSEIDYPGDPAADLAAPPFTSREADGGGIGPRVAGRPTSVACRFESTDRAYGRSPGFTGRSASA